MKFKLISIIAAAAVLSAFTTFNAGEKDLVGEWKVADASIASMTKSVIAKAVEANPDAEDQITAAKDQIVELIKSVRLTIKGDHTYSNISVQGTKGGKWELVNNGHNINFTKEDGTVRKDSVLILSPEKLKLFNGDLKDTVTYVHP